MLSTLALGMLLALLINLQTLTEMSALPTTTISTSTQFEKRQASGPNCNNSSDNCRRGNGDNNVVPPNNTTTSK